MTPKSKTLLLIFIGICIFSSILYFFVNKNSVELQVFDVRVEPTVIGADPFTNQRSYKIVGKTSKNTKSILINGKEINTYSEETEDWEYIVSEKEGNLQTGANEFRIEAVDNKGKKSEPQFIMINNEAIRSVRLENGGAELTGSISNVPNPMGN